MVYWQSFLFMVPFHCTVWLSGSCDISRARDTVVIDLNILVFNKIKIRKKLL